MPKRLISGYFSSIPLATLITATLADEEEKEAADDGSQATGQDGAAGDV